MAVSTCYPHSSSQQTVRLYRLITTHYSRERERTHLVSPSVRPCISTWIGPIGWRNALSILSRDHYSRPRPRPRACGSSRFRRETDAADGSHRREVTGSSKWRARAVACSHAAAERQHNVTGARASASAGDRVCVHACRRCVAAAAGMESSRYRGSARHFN